MSSLLEVAFLCCYSVFVLRGTECFFFLGHVSCGVVARLIVLLPFLRVFVQGLRLSEFRSTTHNPVKAP